MAWTFTAALVVVTVAPIGLRPVLLEAASLERLAAYALLGLLFALAYPRHRLLVLTASIALAGAFEAAQLLTASRHGRLPDFLAKASGAAAGVVLGRMLLAVLDRRARKPAPCPQPPA